MRTQGIIGSAIMAVGGMSPLMHIPIVGNWNYFDVDQRLAIAFYVLVLVGLTGSFAKKIGLIRFAGWGAVVLVLITLAGIYLKAHDSFSFLHFKKLVNLAAGLVKYKWGWYVILAGAFILITVRKPKVVRVT
ncbi:hypothetical protein [Pedobacter metabolipauper]|uniref:Uncharacterized protein n=1 Tax=Pedobacter metabolipauper TaxID=425513 RepID=A0A4R6SUB6_9SPHI|nr:hypothetical protein [Pedobacter metabolipauper]TDQ08543.1 hypothetical protein ATK78_3059 [Pedobacter metabolipauper]